MVNQLDDGHPTLKEGDSQFTEDCLCQWDTLHKLSTTLSKSHAVIVLENLQIKNMTKSAQGDVEVPGKGQAEIRAKSRHTGSGLGYVQDFSGIPTMLVRWSGNADVVGALNILVGAAPRVSLWRGLGCQTL